MATLGPPAVAARLQALATDHQSALLTADTETDPPPRKEGDAPLNVASRYAFLVHNRVFPNVLSRLPVGGRSSALPR